MSENAVKLGVIGLGNIGQQHIKNIQKFVSGCEITALCSRSPVSATELSAMGMGFGEESASIKHFTDYKALIDSGLVDAVIIASPTMAHKEQGLYALNNDLHVLMEKPIGLSILEGEELLNACDAQAFALMLNQRADPLFVEMKTRMKRLGEIQRTHWTMTNWFRPDVYFQVSDWRATWKGEGGGLLVNQCIHNLDIFQWLCGMPVSVTGFCGFGRYHDIEVEDEATAYFTYENGATGVFCGSTGEAPGINRFDIVGTHGTLSFDGKALVHRMNNQSTADFCKSTHDMFGMPVVESVDVTPKRQINQHAVIIQNFINAILQGEALIAPAHEGLNSLSLANSILLSSWLNQSIALPLESTLFQIELDRRIATSSLRKKADIKVSVDMEKSFR